MRLIIGGANQGKLQWYLSQCGCEQEIMDGELLPIGELPSKKVFNHLHRWVFRVMEAGEEPQHLLEQYLEKCPDAVILCDEVGCGVVPIHPLEREWRETTGRLCCQLAKQAAQVDRIFCGLAMNLKKEG